jgi:hypothetical protein
LRKLLTVTIFFLIPFWGFSQGTTLVVGKGAYYAGGNNAYTVIAGNIKNDGNISTPLSNLKIIGSLELQRVTCYTLSGSYCPNIFNTSVYNTVLGNVDQQNPNGISIETNTIVNGTHLFTRGSTEIREGNYWLLNAVTPFSGNDVSSKFFITTGLYHGLLKQNNISLPVLFPVGTAANASDYTPATISYSGTADSFGVRVFDDVYSAYDTSNGDPVGGLSGITNVGFVKKTWIVNKGTTVTGGFATTGFTAMLQWNNVNENFYFTPSRDDDISVVRNHDTLWIPQDPQGPSTNPYGPGPYTRTDLVTYDNNFYRYYPIAVSAINHVLPVIGLNLKAYLSGQNVNLKWTTITEINTVSFSIERSTDGINYSSIGHLPAAGNTNTIRYYSFTDFDVSSFMNYYRIRAIDKDGKFTLSNTVLIKINELTTAIGVLTNPAVNNIYIFFKNVPGDYTIDLFNGIGIKIKTEKTSAATGTYTFKMITRELAAGVYYLKIYNHQTKKITTISIIMSK